MIENVARDVHTNVNVSIQVIFQTRVQVTSWVVPPSWLADGFIRDVNGETPAPASPKLLNSVGKDKTFAARRKQVSRLHGENDCLFSAATPAHIRLSGYLKHPLTSWKPYSNTSHHLCKPLALLPRSTNISSVRQCPPSTAPAASSLSTPRTRGPHAA